MSELPSGGSADALAAAMAEIRLRLAALEESIRAKDKAAPSPGASPPTLPVLGPPPRPDGAPGAATEALETFKAGVVAVGGEVGRQAEVLAALEEMQAGTPAVAAQTASGTAGADAEAPPVAPSRPDGRQADANVAALKALQDMQAQAPERTAVGAAAQGAQLTADFCRRLLESLQEISDLMQMSSAQRRGRRRRRQAALADVQADRARQAIDAGDFATAEDAMAELSEAVPDDPRGAELAGRLAQARAAANADDLRRCRTRIEDLIAAGGFAEALDLAQGLAHRQPSPETSLLLESVGTRTSPFIGEQRHRAYSELDHLAEARKWRQAHAAARQFLQKYPGCPEAALVSDRIKTLEDNARIEEVRNLRDRIRELIEKRRLPEAVKIARLVLSRFPETAAAEELRRQLPRLEERARTSP